MSLALDLLHWNKKQPHRYPWIGEQDPYKILLSEFLLQQTRSAQALKYYNTLIDRFPTIKSLAAAHEDELLAHWQGLGYYSRARNLHKTAKLIVSDNQGLIPHSYDALIALPGIGPYSAAAISSFAFGERKAVVDGNVFRFLARVYEIATPIDSSAARNEFTSIATGLLGRHDPAQFNQAIMNFGAHVCTPKSPKCTICPVSKDCLTFASGRQTEYPLKRKKIKLRIRFFHFLDLRFNEQLVLQKRTSKDIWQGLYQFPLIEMKSTKTLSEQRIEQKILSCLGITKSKLQSVSSVATQTLSHQIIHSKFYHIKLLEPRNKEDSLITLVFHENLENFALPRIVTQYLNIT